MGVDVVVMEGTSLAASRHLPNQLITSSAVGESNVCQSRQLLLNESGDGASVPITLNMFDILG